MELNEQVNQIPAWKRWVVCTLLRRRAWKVARAYNVVACDLMNGDNWELGDNLRSRGDNKWAALYGLPTPKPQNDEQWQSRAVMAEHSLEWERKRREQLEQQVALLKRTAKAYRELKRQRSLCVEANTESRQPGP